MLVPRQFLAGTAYSMFRRAHVVVAGQRNSVVTLQELQSGPDSALLLHAKRRALTRLRATLNQQASNKLDALIASAATRPRAGPKHFKLLAE
jgi:hypothetical protein